MRLVCVHYCSHNFWLLLKLAIVFVKFIAFFFFTQYESSHQNVFLDSTWTPLHHSNLPLEPLQHTWALHTAALIVHLAAHLCVIPTTWLQLRLLSQIICQCNADLLQFFIQFKALILTNKVMEYLSSPLIVWTRLANIFQAHWGLHIELIAWFISHKGDVMVCGKRCHQYIWIITGKCPATLLNTSIFSKIHTFGLIVCFAI